jgi:pimeloyl-ACP methyl ester carboxylesterase
MRTHLNDLLAVLDAAGVERAILVGHSMGAYLAARLAADYPDRAAAVVLVDGGPPVAVPPGEDPEELVAMLIEQLVSRLKMTFESADEYVQRWSEHPALRREWNDDLDAYARFELAGPPGDMRCIVSEEAVAVDCADLMRDELTQRALDRVTAPLYLARAERGLLDDQPVLSDAVVDAFIAAHPDAVVEHLHGTNHYTVVLGSGSGPRRIAALIRAAIPRTIRV